jgi:mannose-1-phosphate guanylyltransferase/mannose-6-phosphate isomerase
MPAAQLVEGPIVPVILAGGSGTRLWPVSRAAFPKHLVELTGSQSLLQATAERVLRTAPADRVITITAASQAVLVRRQLQACAPALTENLLLEPLPRNTAAAVGLAALHAARKWGGSALLWICASDHLILDSDRLLEAVRLGAVAARSGHLVTFGITPSRAETGFGWIEAGEALGQAPGVHVVRRFVEKPPRAEAEAMLAAGGHCWNSGMFLMRADAVLGELRRFEPALVTGLEEIAARMAAGPGGEIPPELFAALPSLPIDKAVMERSDRVAMVPCDPQWSDIGSWRALWELAPHDAAGNAVAGDVLLQDAHNNLVKAEHRLVALAGVRDLAVIETPDAVLVADKERGEPIKELVSLLVRSGRREADIHAREVRPWGQFTVLHEGTGFKVKEVVVDAGQHLTLQYHPHRDETWVIVEGSASVDLAGEPVTLGAGESLRVPRGTPHRLANPTGKALRLIEIGWGTGLADEDTVRLDPA